MKLMLLALTVPVAAVALLNARREYRVHGRLTFFGTLLLCLMLLLPNLVLEYATRYTWPNTALETLGAMIGAAGLVLCFLGIAAFQSLSKVFCLDAGELSLDGPYRWSRNPQYVGWCLFLVGFSMMDWSLWCLAVIVVVTASLHLLVLVEEEHLRRVFGQPYVEFCRRTPRYFGLGNRG